jgi:hypothetical protein|tara:strand:- start:95 stop:334 length:240 start_codon:yes stop_codon:yes gene_type:complete
MPLKIANGKEIIELKDKYCLQLEGEINKFGYLDNWPSIGDHLYYFVCPNMSHPKSSDTLNVSQEKFSILKNIIENNHFI